ncbi:MAG: sigma-70 family RNA polymerase sigma factor [Sedimentisphaerales bacterium]|nr:sigma-70 family RNA polymerase sigma factor [Sedimentisphaerales bacterium]
MTDVTRILNAIEQGDPRATEELLPLVYEELRLLAAQKMSQESPGQTLQATALVHEAYIRLLEGKDQNWNSRGHFFRAAAEAMRRILVEIARRKKTQRHGDEQAHRSYDGIEIPIDTLPEDIISLDEALTKLAAQEPALAEVVKLRYFAGLTMEQIAGIMSVSRRTATSYWAYARSWLRREITAGDESYQ